jgi:hypothetical protein
MKLKSVLNKDMQRFLYGTMNGVVMFIHSLELDGFRTIRSLYNIPFEIQYKRQLTNVENPFLKLFIKLGIQAFQIG